MGNGLVRVFSLVGILVGIGLFLFVPMIGLGTMLFPNGTYEIIQILSIILPILVLILAGKSFSKYISALWFIALLLQVIQLTQPILKNMPYSLSSPAATMMEIIVIQLVIALVVTVLLFKSFSKK